MGGAQDEANAYLRWKIIAKEAALEKKTLASQGRS